jgi:tRNA (cytidine/uridine-2'-O-)-methyltransferase
MQHNANNIDYSIALYQPENPDNVGAIIRICDCFGLKLQIIEPTGFIFEAKVLKNKQLDYSTTIVTHKDFDAFLEYNTHKRIVLFTPHTSTNIDEFRFSKFDVLLFGRESVGVPTSIAQYCNALVRLNIEPHARSLSLPSSVAIVAQIFRIEVTEVVV